MQINGPTIFFHTIILLFLLFFQRFELQRGDGTVQIYFNCIGYIEFSWSFTMLRIADTAVHASETSQTGSI